MSVLAVIPARMASTRLPGKPLADILGKPMIQWVCESASRAKRVDRVVVATDDERVMKAVSGFGGEAIMTSPELNSGTDRVAAVAKQISADFYVNVQGDEPMMDPRAIDQAVAQAQEGRFGLTTVMTPMSDPDDLTNPAVVKVLADLSGRAVYFSRYGIPYSRGAAPEAGGNFACKRHVGLYVYSKQMLTRFSSLPQSKWEVGEMLEQLRALENGIEIGITELNFKSVGVDTPQDLEMVRKEIKGVLHG